MNAFAWLALAMSPLALPALAAGATAEPALASQYEPSADPLTTAKFRQIDPEELNPHRRNWALERHLSLKGLEAVELKGGMFGVKLEGLESDAKSYVRPEGPWYQPLSDFACRGIKRHPWFATRDGARQAADAAAREWGEVLGQERLKLARGFARIMARSRLQALGKATQFYHGWYEQTERIWRARVYDRARKAELKPYGEAVAAAKFDCASAPAQAERMRDRMEPISDAPARQLLARAPSRRWEGAYSVRLSLEVGDKKLNGAFLIDSTAARSIVSPAWLTEQGIPEAYVELPDVALDRALFAANPGGGLARRAGFDRVTLSDFPIPVTEFLLYETAIFDVPRTIAPCCAGVLGNDFLRKFAVELDPGIPPEVRLYEPQGYSEGREATWEEASFYQRDAIASPCRIVKGSVLGAGKKPEAVTPVRWSTAGGAALRTPTGARPGAVGLELQCGETPVATDLRVESRAAPQAIVGNPLLSKGSVTLDLPNGRIWFPKGARLAKILENRSGLDFSYVLRKAQRVLTVRSLHPRSPAARTLGQAGLKPGMTITEINGTPADELDRWQVDRWLAGAYGPTVNLAWATPAGTRTATLKVREPDSAAAAATQSPAQPSPRP